MGMRTFAGLLLLSGVLLSSLGQAAPGDERSTQTSPPVRKLAGHRGGITALAFHPAGQWLAVGGGNGDIRIWSLPAGELLARLSDPREGGARISQLGVSADGRYLSMTSRTSVVVWDVADLKKISIRYEDTYDPNPALVGTISGDGKLCFFARYQNKEGRLQAYSLVNRSLFDIPLPPNTHVVSMAAIPDAESTLAAAYCAAGPKGEKGAIVLAGLGDVRVIDKDVPPPGEDDPLGIQFSSDGRWLVAHNASQVTLWRVPGSQVIRGEAIILPVSATAAAVGRGDQLAVAVQEPDDPTATIHLYKLAGASPQLLERYTTAIEYVSALAYSPDGSLLAIADDTEGTVELRPVSKGKK